MVGLGWYLDVIGSDSYVLVWVFEDFGENRKSAKRRKTGQKSGPFAAARLKGQNGLPSATLQRSSAMPRHSYCSHEPFSDFCFRTPRICTPIV